MKTNGRSANQTTVTLMKHLYVYCLFFRCLLWMLIHSLWMTLRCREFANYAMLSQSYISNSTVTAHFYHFPISSTLITGLRCYSVEWHLLSLCKAIIHLFQTCDENMKYIRLGFKLWKVSSALKCCGRL